MEKVRGLLLLEMAVNGPFFPNIESCVRLIKGWLIHRFGHAFNMDTGTSTGEIGGHSKVINAVSIRQSRPYRAATAADDSAIVFHQGVLNSTQRLTYSQPLSTLFAGPPFKFDKVVSRHKSTACIS